jgi:hypothetical protein
MSEKKEFHFIPAEKREHVRSPDCWCKPQRKEDETGIIWLHDIERPTISESTDIAEVSAFFEQCTGQKPHAELLKATLGSVTKVMVAKVSGEIVGMAAYSMVMNPFVAGVGHALLVDLRNGYDLDIQ